MSDETVGVKSLKFEGSQFKNIRADVAPLLFYDFYNPAYSESNLDDPFSYVK